MKTKIQPRMDTDKHGLGTEARSRVGDNADAPAGVAAPRFHKRGYGPLVLAALLLALTFGSARAQMPMPTCANNDPTGPGGCGCPPPNCNAQAKGLAPSEAAGANPFRAYGANLFREVPDVKLFGLQGLEFKRYYNSRLDRNSTGFGGGATWTHNYAWVMAGAGTNPDTGNPLITVDFPTGESLTYERTAANEWRTIYGKDSWVQQSGTNYILRFGNGWSYQFGKQTSGSYRFLSYTDPQTLTYTLTYNPSGRITQIDDASGQYLKLNWMTFTPPGGSSVTVISNVVAGNTTGSTTATVKYTYTNLMDGWAVVVALAGALYSDGAQATYGYWQETANRSRNLLAEAIDPRYAGTATHMKYEYWPNGDAVDGRVYRELNGATGEEIVHTGRYSSLAISDVVYKNGAHISYMFTNDPAVQGNKIQWIQDASGNTTWYVYGDGGNGYLLRLTNALGYVTRYGHDALGRLTGLTNADNSTEFWTYDSVGNELTHTDELGRTTTTTRDSSGRATKITYPDTTWEGFSYNSLNQPLTHTNRNGGVDRMTYNSVGLLLGQTNALGGVTTYYYSWRIPVTTIDALGQTTRLGFDERGLLLAQTNADNSVVRYDYDDFGNRIAMTNELGKVTRWTYDEFKRMTSMVDPLQRTNLYSYDFTLPGGGGCGCGNTKDKPSLVTSPSGIDTAYIYDEEWRTVGVITGYGTSEAAESQTVYDAVGNVIQTISPEGETNTFTYDNCNRRIAATDALGRVTRWTNDVAGRVTAMVAPDGTPTFYGYDAMGRRSAETNALQQVTRYGYDASGNLTSLTDASGNITTWNYDLLNRQTLKTYADTKQDKYGYDAVGNLKAQTNAMNEVCLHAYDKRNRLTNSVWIVGSAPTVSRSYDSLGRLKTLNNGNASLGYAYDDANQLLAETNTIGSITRVVSYGYDLDGRRQKLVYPTGNTLTNTFTARGQLKEIFANGPPPIATFAYDLDGRRTNRALANGVTTVYDYDMAGQLTNLLHATSGGTVASFAYRYNAVGSRTNAVREDARSEAYGYDAIQQLTAVDYGDSTSEGFNYDTMGNLRSRTGLSPVSNFVTNNLNQYTAIDGNPQTFDLKGNLLVGGTSSTSLMTNSYDAQNRLLTVQRGTNSATFLYDGHNRCVQRTINGVTTTFVYHDWNLIAEYQGTTPVAEYIHGPGVDETLAMATALGTVYYSGDALNSTAALTDGSGNLVERYRYTAFGQPSIYDTNSTFLASSSYGNRFAFQGREWFAELNLTDHRNRYYAPELQRWLNRDPLGEPGFEAQRRKRPSVLGDGPHPYLFNKNSPVGQIDSLGLDCKSDCWNAFDAEMKNNSKETYQCLKAVYKDCLYALLIGGGGYIACVQIGTGVCGLQATQREVAAMATLAGCLSGCKPSCPPQ